MATGAILAIEIFRAIRPRRMRGLCIYRPSCSAYAIGALRTFGFRRGCAVAWRRLRRCNSCNDGGYDPLPISSNS